MRIRRGFLRIPSTSSLLWLPGPARAALCHFFFFFFFVTTAPSLVTSSSSLLRLSAVAAARGRLEAAVVFLDVMIVSDGSAFTTSPTEKLFASMYCLRPKDPMTRKNNYLFFYYCPRVHDGAAFTFAPVSPTSAGLYYDSAHHHCQNPIGSFGKVRRDRVRPPADDGWRSLAGLPLLAQSAANKDEERAVHHAPCTVQYTTDVHYIVHRAVHRPCSTPPASALPYMQRSSSQKYIDARNR